MTTADVARYVILNHRNIFPNVVLVVCAGFAIPIGTADNERGFSDLKLHRTRLRILLGDSTLEELMRICLEGPTQHTPEYRALREVIAYWAGQRERRCDERFDMPSRLAIARRRRQKVAKAARKMQKKLKLQKFSSRQKNARRRADRRASHRTEREKKQKEQKEEEKQKEEKGEDPDRGLCVDLTDQEALAALEGSQEDPTAAQARAAKLKKDAKLEAAKQLRAKLLAEYERNDRPRRRVTSARLLRAIRDRG